MSDQYPNSSLNINGKQTGPANFGPEPQFKNILKLLPLILVMLAGWWVADYFFGDQWENTAIRGSYETSVYIPEGKNAGKSLLVTDNTFYFVSEFSSAGKRSIETNSFFNRMYFYLYNQDSGQVEKRVKLNFEGIPPDLESYFINGKIWLIGAGGSLKSNDIWVINPDTLEVEKRLADFESSLPELKVGVLSIDKPYNRTEELNININLIDGSNVRFFPGYEKVFKSYDDFLDWKLETKTSKLLGNLDVVYLTTNNPKKITWASGPEALMMYTMDEISSPDYDYDSILRFKKLTGKSYENKEIEIKNYQTDLNFIEGRILFQDGQYALIIHQKTAKDLSPRLLTLIDIDEGAKWTVDEADLPQDLRVNPNDTFTQLFFVDSYLRAYRSDENIFFNFLDKGTVNFDLETGKVKYSIGKWNI